MDSDSIPQPSAAANGEAEMVARPDIALVYSSKLALSSSSSTPSISAGQLSSNRLCLKPSSSLIASPDGISDVLIATSNQVYQCSPRPSSLPSSSFEASRQNCFVSIPVPLESQPIMHPVVGALFHDEIQHLSLHPSGSMAAASDAHGRTALLFSSSSASSSSTTVSQWLDMGTTAVDFQRGDAGWSGFAFHPTENTGCLGRYWYKDLTFYDVQTGRRTRTLHTPQPVAAVQFSAPNILCAIEGNALALYDSRQKDSAACVQRFVPCSSDPLLALTYSASQNLIAVAGFERTVHVCDPRKLGVRGRWPHAIKHEISWISFSEHDPKLIYAAGTDSELSCGKWTSDSRIRSLNADSRWTGLAKSNDGNDTIYGMSDNGSLYLVKNPHLMVNLRFMAKQGPAELMDE